MCGMWKHVLKGRSWKERKTAKDVEAEGEKGGEEKENRRVNLIKVHSTHIIWKCHNETLYFVQLMCTNKKSGTILT
jgi:hypothetical protein